MTNSKLRKHRFVFAHSQWKRYDAVDDMAKHASLNMHDLMNKIVNMFRHYRIR